MENKQQEEIMKNAQRVQEQLAKSAALKAIEVMNNDSSMRKVFESIGEEYNKLFTKLAFLIADETKKSISYIGHIFTKNFSEYISNLTKTIKAINLPQFSEEQKNNFIEIHKQWGCYGWTDIRRVPICRVKTVKTQEDADELMLSITTDEEMERCFSEIKEVLD